MEPEFITPVGEQDTDAYRSWRPVLGMETDRFLSQKPVAMRDRLLTEGVRVLGRCVRPGTAPSPQSRRAGLVLGYVQSGKTSSFTTVTALARDNDFQFVVIIAGTSTLLQDQTSDRLIKDLGLADMDAFRRWSLLRNPSPENDAGATLRSLLAQHADPEADKFDLGVPLVVVMKQHTHLTNLNSVLEDVRHRGSIAALIIDDEAHMHSPNVAALGLESTTYAQIKALRKQLPVHTLLQYTATPQAPLLASIADELSPEFVCLLEPGEGYTGGQYFFVNHHDAFVERIEDSELYALDPDQFADLGPPPSLRKAFITYLVTCAVSRYRQEREPAHSSMLVHPHARTDVHKAWLRSIEAMKDELEDTLGLPADDPDRLEFLTGDLQSVWKDLSQSDPHIPAIDDLLGPLRTVLSRLHIKSINSAGTANVPWPIAPYWVLVGGNLLGVGFTVEGLRTTHMMRSPGMRLADTIQQRARFFGYKDAYASSCRAWLQRDLDASFVDYVKHERAVRSSLEEIEREGRPLKEWKRVFLLAPGFQLTRKAARRITLADFSLENDGWCHQQWFARGEVDILADNRETIQEFVQTRPFHDAAEISGDTPATTHQVSTCSLTELRSLLSQLKFVGADSSRFTALGLMLAGAEEDTSGGGRDCTVVRMATGLLPENRQRSVGWTDAARTTGKVTLHQGRNPRQGKPRYLGDASARRDGRITLQIHQVDLRESQNGPVLPDGTGLPFVTVFVPDELRTGFRHEL